MQIDSAVFFSSLKPEQLDMIQKLMIPRNFARNDIIFHEEQEADGLYLIRSGMVKIVKSTPDGHNKILAILNAGEIFGEMAFFENNYRTATVIALQETSTVFAPIHQFDQLIQSVPGLGLQLVTFLAQRLRTANQQVTDALFVKARPRLIKSLLRLCRTCGSLQDNAGIIPVPLTHEDIAELAGISRETATRLLSELEAENLLRKERKAVHLLDIVALEAESYETF